MYNQDLKDITPDVMVTAAIGLIRQSSGLIKMKELAEKVNLSQSAFEKRFRKVVGAAPKKFASIVRLQWLISQGASSQSMTEIGYNSGYYDQAHFIKDFKNFTGETPEKFFKKK